MKWKKCLGFGLAVCLGGGTTAYAQNASPVMGIPQAPTVVTRTVVQTVPTSPSSVYPMTAQTAYQPPPGDNAPGRQDLPGEPFAPAAVSAGTPETPKYGPTPLTEVGIFQKLIDGDCPTESKIKFAGWMDFDYTYRSSGSGQNNIAPVENRFGNEALARELGLYIYKPLDEKKWSWGFNVIFLAGADASFLTPTAGGWQNTNPRFGADFTDLNLTAHLDILTEGGVDIKAGRQTTCLGPMGALAWQRPFNSSDYAWYNLEEGRYTGVSANWKITKQLSWYNGVEIGGWGVFFDDPTHGVDYLTQINYWLDEDAKKTKVWLTVLTGPTGFFSNGNSTTVEIGLQHNYSDRFYQILDSQMTYSKAPIFFAAPPGYQERAYDVYTVLGYHVTTKVDFNSRFEWYKDDDGGGYPGGFGTPHTDYFETTLGFDYHPTKWLQIRPEARYDHATHDAFGPDNDRKNQLSLGGDVLIKF